ncbi:MAG: alpha/beta fold hydrolase [Candidatus Dormibacteria bacterium]
MADFLEAAPPGRVVLVPGRGEMFVRDSGEATARRGTLLLLHGWMFSADAHWISNYRGLIDAGYRVIAVDHRGHGRGIRSPEPFRLQDCADDAAGLLRVLNTGPVTLVGYSMGGAVVQLLARAHPDLVDAMVLCATTNQWSDDRRLRLSWKAMGMLEFALLHANRQVWQRLTGGGVIRNQEVTDWVMTELERNDSRAVAEAGREMARFDSRPWLKKVRIPAAVICPLRDELVPPRFQRRLAADLFDGRLYELEGTHLVLARDPQRYLRVLLLALDDLQERVARRSRKASA